VPTSAAAAARWGCGSGDDGSKRKAFTTLKGLLLMVGVHVARKRRGQSGMVGVDRFHEVSHVGPLRQAQSHSFLRRLDLLLTVRDVELAEVDASDARRHRHVVTAADMLSIVDQLVVAHRLDVGVNFLEDLSKTSPPASTQENRNY